MNHLLRLALNYFLLNLNAKTNDKKDILSKKAKETTDNRSLLIRVTPYIIVLMCFIVLVLFLYAMIVHGQHATATEANLWYNGELA